VKWKNCPTVPAYYLSYYDQICSVGLKIKLVAELLNGKAPWWSFHDEVSPHMKERLSDVERKELLLRLVK